MSALVTGGAGFIGSHVVDRLVEKGMDVVVFDDFSVGKLENLASSHKSGRVDVIVGSVLNEKDVWSAMKGCDLVFHMAAKSVRHSIGAPLENQNVNALGTLVTLEAARQHKVKSFVYCSSSEVYGNVGREALSETTTVCQPVTIYGASKYAGEGYAKAYFRTYGLPTTVIRPFNAYGPRAHSQGQSGEVIPRFAARILNGQSPLIFGSGRQMRDYTYVTEIAHGIVLASDTSAAIGQTINLAVGCGVSVRDIAQKLSEISGRTDLVPETRPERPGDVDALLADTRASKALLNYSPEIQLSEGLGRYLRWLKETTWGNLPDLDKIETNWNLP